MELVRKYRIRKTGKNGSVITIPPSYMEDVGLRHGDRVRVFRDGDRLVIETEGRNKCAS